MLRRILSLWMGLGCVLAACDDSSDGPQVCGAVMCNERQRCDVTNATMPVCVCVEGYAGSACTSCATGFQKNAAGYCEPVPVACTNANACGGSAKGVCIPGSGITADSCMCNAGYTGHACGSCAAGYQDNDRNGTCTPSCASMPNACAAPKTCSDTAGTLTCACPANSTGANCESCLSGFVKAPDGTCVKGCSAGVGCTGNQTCDLNVQPVPQCVCKPGYAGAACTSCAAGYTADGTGACVMAVPAGTTFLGAGRVANTDVLLALDVTKQTATSIRPITSIANLKLAGDPTKQVVYAATGTALSQLDPATGALTTIASIPTAQSLTVVGGALWTIPNLSPYLLKRIDPVTKVVADLGQTGLAGVQGLAVEAAGVLLAARFVNNAPTFSRVDAATGAATPLGTFTVDAQMRLPSSNQQLALANGPGGSVWMIARVGRTANEIVMDHCRKVAVGLGFVGYEAAPFTTLESPYNGVGAGLTKTLTSMQASGKEIVAYVSYGSRTAARATLRVDTRNPETFVCLATYEENLLLQVGAMAKFAGIALSAGGRAPLALEVEAGFPPQTVDTKLVHVYPGTSTVDSSFMAYSISKVYTSAEWTTTRRLATYVSAWSSDANAPAQLFEVDLATLKPKRVVPFAGVELLPVLAQWSP